jgi:RND family efflux transporter MFP subunit
MRGSPSIGRHCWRGAGALLALTALAACNEHNSYVPPPPPKVTVAKPEQRTVTLYLNATGNAAAVNTADLVARVAGFVEKIDYQDGAEVKKGKVLFTIEPESYKLKWQQSQALETASRSTVAQTEADYHRNEGLAKTNAVSKSSLDSSKASYDTAVGNLAQAEINTKLAAITYGYTSVTAPFDGIVTSRQVSVGEYVGATATPTELATIVQLDPIYVNFTIDEQDVIRIRAEIRKRGLTREDLKKVPVEVGLQTEQGYPHKGTLNYAAPTVDSTTGTLAARAILPNPGRVLLPGMFVRVRVPTGKLDNALLVPETALGTDQGGRYLLVVGKDDVVEQRPVEIGPLEGGERVIEKGIAAGDRVIVAGLLRAIPGQRVEPQLAAGPAPGAK